MRHASGVTPVKESNLELGVVICKRCQEVIATLPTSGVKKIYGVCGKKSCAEQTQRSGA